MSRSIRLVLGLALGTFILGAPILAQAQDNPEGKIIPVVEYEMADVREALRALFRNVGVSYTIDGAVQGTITVSLKNVPFGTALQNVLRQVDATYRVEGGIYNIVRREDNQVTVPNSTDTSLPTTTDTNAGKVIRRIKIRHADPYYIAVMLAQNKSFTSIYPEMSTLYNTPSGSYGNNGGYGNNNNSGYGNNNSGFGNNGSSGFGSSGSGGFGGSSGFGSGGFGGSSGGFGGGGRGGF